jgi:hypothetical protein
MTKKKQPSPEIQALQALARQADPKVAKTIEDGTGWPCVSFDRYASMCLLGFADRGVDLARGELL